MCAFIEIMQNKETLWHKTDLNTGQKVFKKFCKLCYQTA